jgi:geranylgeranyl diphosphate synthase type II
LTFSLYKNKIEAALQEYVSSRMGEKTSLRDACEYALNGGGKRLRPILVLMIAEALQKGLDVMPVALSVEFFHTASLIADDLPCMDDDDKRRGRPSLHRAFEESVALLASYTFIAAGYEGISRNGVLMKKMHPLSSKADEAVLQSLKIATEYGGILGATSGQYLDLFPPDTSWGTIQTLILRKTITLFQISFVFGWLFGGGEVRLLEEVKQAAYHLGMAFQVADDLQDASSSDCKINVVSALGLNRALSIFQEEMGKFEHALRELTLWNHDFQEVSKLLHRLISKGATSVAP